jgi:hypothetical protein
MTSTPDGQVFRSVNQSWTKLRTTRCDKVISRIHKIHVRGLTLVLSIPMMMMPPQPHRPIMQAREDPWMLDNLSTSLVLESCVLLDDPTIINVKLNILFQRLILVPHNTTPPLTQNHSRLHQLESRVLD